MISNYIEAPWRLARLRATCVGPHLDHFTNALAETGHLTLTIRGYLCTADHLGRWADDCGLDIESWDEDVLVGVGRHLRRSRVGAGSNMG